MSTSAGRTSEGEMVSGMAKRKELILAIIESESVPTQETLAAALAARGQPASQASVSRAVAALGLIKQHGRYVAPDSGATREDPLRVRIRSNLLEAANAGANLVVLKTPPGEASGVALAIDRLMLPGFVGSVAGDDTIFVAVSDQKAFRRAL